MQNKFENFLQRMVTSSEQMSSKKDKYNRAAAIVSPDRTIEKTVLQQSLTNAGALIFSLGNNNEVVWGEDGITLTNTETRSTVPGQVKITGTGIFSSNSLDSSGVRVWVPIVTGDGVNLSQASYGFLDIKSVDIFDSDNKRFLWNENGIYAYAVDTNGNTVFDSFVRYFYEGLDFQLGGDVILSLNWNGLQIGLQNDYVKLTSTYGLQVFDDQATPHERVQIGRFYTGETPDTPTAYGMRLRDVSGNITLYTDSNGKLWLNDVLSVGTAGDDSVGLTSEYDNSDSVRIWAGGDRTIAWGETGAPHFMVDKAGKLYATEIVGVEQEIILTITDETNSITTGTGKFSIRVPFAMSLTKAPRASLSTASTSGEVIVDINLTGTGTIMSTYKLRFDQDETTTVSYSGTAATLTTTSFTDNDELTFDIDSAGTGAKGLKITLYYKKV